MIKLIHWSRFVDKIDAFTTTRLGGVSKAPYDTLNLSFTVQDDVANVIQNRALLFHEFGVGPNDVVLAHQTHSDRTLVVSKKDGGRGFAKYDDGMDGDGLLTTDKNLLLGIYHADCVPVFFFVPSIPLVGVVHAGEQGSLDFITQKAVQLIKEKFHVDPKDIYAYIGPTLHFSHRKISKEKAEDLLRKGYDEYGIIKLIDDKYLLDLPLLNFQLLRKEGIPTENIDVSEFCTYENKDLFFSYEREKVTGRMMSFIRLR
jgi:YfiH family protein